MTLQEYINASKAEIWKLDQGDVFNLLDEAIERIEELEKRLEKSELDKHIAGVMKRGHYDVQVFDENGNEVDRRNNIVAWTRREAYFEVMNEMKLHKTWDSTRVKDHVS